MKIKRVFLLSALLFLFSLQSFCQDDYSIITGKWLYYSNARNSLYDHFSSEAFVLLNDRNGKVAGTITADDWIARRNYVREKLGECIGDFPEKSPLNARIMRTLEKEGFRVEHIVYESLPGFFVTSSLYLPSGMKKKQKYPAVIYCSGHSADGYRSAPYQHVILNLVKKGFIVFAFDPVGQGERIEYFDASGNRSELGGPTSEHSYPGAQAFITGNSQAKFMIWDGIRAVDYLVSRKEVDPGRIGITGRSGGGTQAAYIAAFDERILAAAPENYITNFTRLLQTIGPQDAEQNFAGFIAKGLDHADFLVARAPKPALMITTTGDMFSIQGAIETEKEVATAYNALGKPENFSRCEDDAGHASTLRNREALYAFFQKHLGNPGNANDEEVSPLTREELMVTESGQVSVSLKGETVFSLNLRDATKLEEQMGESRSLKDYPEAAVEWARKLSGYDVPGKIPEPVFTGRTVRKEYKIEKYFIQGMGEYIVPYLLFLPPNPSGKAMVYIHPEGKAADADDEIKKLVLRGWTVLAPDLPGTGETGRGDLKGDANFGGASHNLWYAGILTGKTITGIRARELTVLSEILKKRGFDEITGFAVKDISPALLHSAAFSDSFSSIVLSEPYSSYMSVVEERKYNPLYVLSAVPGSMGKYDLPDLAASLAPRKLVVAGAVDGSGKKDNSDRISQDLEIVRAAYRKAGAEGGFRVIDILPDDLSELF